METNREVPSGGENGRLRARPQPGGKTMKLFNECSRWLLIGVMCVAGLRVAEAQSGYDDDRVMLQGFYWESSRHGDPRFPAYGTKRWYEIVKEQAGTIRDGHFDLIWLPPPFYAGAQSAGYGPKELFNFSNSYGSQAQHRAALEALLQAGVEPVADIVINHRDGSTGWAGFTNPAWGPWAICADDECFSNPASELNGLPKDKRGAPEEKPEYNRFGTTYAYGAFRDIDHSNREVRRDIVKALLSLRSLGYRGWRYDMVHGFRAHWLAIYNRETHPTFSVGEFQWDWQAGQRGWVWYTATKPGDMTTSSDVFDFFTQFTLKDHKGDYGAWYGFGNGIGLMGDTTDGLPWKNRAVTFLENHDTGHRTNEDGTPENGHAFDNFRNGWEVEQAYAYILTHPGIPCVYWKHYFDWGADLRNKIQALVNARKVAGVHAGCALYQQNNAHAKGIYAAMIPGRHGQLYVRIGGSDADWQPSTSSYHDYQDYAHGAGWKVWVSLPGNPAVQTSPARPAFPVPTFQEASDIPVADAQLD
jgi:alpha-amylase